MTTEHGMLMKGPLVVQTLAGRKTKTRRLVTPANSTAHGWKSANAVWPRLDWPRALPGVMAPLDKPTTGVWRVPLVDPTDDERDSVVLIMPRVLPGHALWIRETWKPADTLVDDVERNPAQWIRYRADGQVMGRFDADDPLEVPAPGRWRDMPIPEKGWTSPFHMPRWASRLVLPVTSVGAERVQEITAAEVLAEGLAPLTVLESFQEYPKGSLLPRKFRNLWDEINGHRDGASWSANPPLWVYGWEPVRP